MRDVEAEAKRLAETGVVRGEAAARLVEYAEGDLDHASAVRMVDRWMGLARPGVAAAYEQYLRESGARRATGDGPGRADSGSAGPPPGRHVGGTAWTPGVAATVGPFSIAPGHRQAMEQEMAKKSSEELAGDMAGLAEEIRDRAIAETRCDVADALKERFLDRGSRSTCGDASPDDCIIEALASMSDRQLQALRDRFSEEGVSSDFRAGLLFAVRFAAAPEWEL